MESELVKRGEEVYQRKKEEWERLYLEKIIAIEVEKEDLAGVGEYPGSKFFFRKVGPCRAAGYLFSLKAIVGRDISDNYKVTFDGIRGEGEVV
ncbi:hypothetical protein CW714_00190 [Methanophagales archaeon]|nr:MAG: hypothetical protein CW714_00190 [Methanophagales archaeon]